MSQEVFCTYCGALAVWVPDVEVYERSYGGMVYLCRPCKAYVGCHKRRDGKPGDKPLGRLADAELRKLKIRGHELFDPIYKAAIEKRGWSKGMARGRAYKWLATNIDIPAKECHFGEFDNERCRLAIKFLESFYASVAAKKG